MTSMTAHDAIFVLSPPRAYASARIRDLKVNRCHALSWRHGSAPRSGHQDLKALTSFLIQIIGTIGATLAPQTQVPRAARDNHHDLFVEEGIR